jgi:hypothetical protein
MFAAAFLFLETFYAHVTTAVGIIASVVSLSFLESVMRILRIMSVTYALPKYNTAVILILTEFLQVLLVIGSFEVMQLKAVWHTLDVHYRQFCIPSDLRVIHLLHDVSVVFGRRQ